jgi:hypothetical protein
MSKLRFARNPRGDKEVTAQQYPLSVPARRLLGIIDQPTSVSYLVRKVRLGELEKHLQELSKCRLISIYEGERKREDVTSGAPEKAPAPLLEQFSPAVLANAKRVAIQYVFSRMPGSSNAVAFEIDAAQNQETLLVALGQAQRDLFDECGRDVASHFFETVVMPTFFADEAVV